jgi:hypothetical protein
MADTATASSITTIKANQGLVLPERRASSVGRGHPSSGRGSALSTHIDAVFLDVLRLDVEEIERVWKQGAI